MTCIIQKKMTKFAYDVPYGGRLASPMSIFLFHFSVEDAN